jgi:glycosyltransferase involved in cell wall biosynthesis
LVYRKYVDAYPDFAKRVGSFDTSARYRAKLFYTVFLNNIFKFLPLIDVTKTPFVFTLYPGGGFLLNHDPEADGHLRTVLASPYFKKVIVTQEVTKRYLLDNGFCSEDSIEFVFGVVTTTKYFQDNEHSKQYYKKDKPTFDICFVAHKYMDRGSDKGYDRFIAIAHGLIKTSPDFRFHVVGGFDKQDIDVSQLGDTITFYGSRDKSFFPEFYSRMDMLISAVTPFLSYPGAFDGFPTTCCTDAALCGAAVVTTDPLHQNTVFKDGNDIIIVPPDNTAIAEKIKTYFNDLNALYRLSSEGKVTFSSIYSLENQMKPRIKVLQDVLTSL